MGHLPTPSSRARTPSTSLEQVLHERCTTGLSEPQAWAAAFQHHLPSKIHPFLAQPLCQHSRWDSSATTSPTKTPAQIQESWAGGEAGAWSGPPAASSLLGGKAGNRFSYILKLPTEVTYLFNTSAQLHALFPGEPNVAWADLSQTQSG